MKCPKCSHIPICPMCGYEGDYDKLEERKMYIEYDCKNEFCKYEFNSENFDQSDIEMTILCPKCEMYNKIEVKISLQKEER